MKKIINTSEAPQAIGPYSQAIQFENTVYLSGQIPLNSQTMTLVSDDFSEQVRQVMQNMQAVCKAAGGSLDHILKLTIYLIDLNDFAILNDIMLEFFKSPYPARSTIQVAGLPKNSKIEIDAVMSLSKTIP